MTFYIARTFEKPVLLNDILYSENIYGFEKAVTAKKLRFKT